jgi:ADP-heptose:LPS heptosyltransferase
MRILVVRRGAIGDTVVTLPTLDLLRDKYKNAYIEVIGNPQYWEIAYKRYYVDCVSSGDTKITKEFYTKEGLIDNEIGRYFSSFDLILAYITDPEGTVTQKLQKAGSKRIIVYPPFPNEEAGIHAVDYTAFALTELGIEATSPLYPTLHLNIEDTDFASSFLLQFDLRKPIIAIHPRTFGIKGWRRESFINLGKWIEKDLGGQVVWILGPAEEETLEAIRNDFPLYQILSFTPLPKVASVIKRASLYIGCDTGISHLAAAAGTPVIALFGPTNPHIWGPRGKRVLVLKAKNLYEIPEERVKEAIKTLIEKNTLEENKIIYME